MKKIISYISPALIALILLSVTYTRSSAQDSIPKPPKLDEKGWRQLFNGKNLDVPHGAPLRLRVERQLGYKQAKYVERIQIVESFSHIAGGQGGYWEDRGYEWYAGI